MTSSSIVKAQRSAFPTAISREIKGVEFYRRLSGFARRDIWPFCLLYAWIVGKAALHLSNYEW